MLFLIPFNVDGYLDIYRCHTAVKTNKMSVKIVNYLLHVNWYVIGILTHTGSKTNRSCYGSLCNKLFTIVSYYQETGLSCIVY